MKFIRILSAVIVAFPAFSTLAYAAVITNGGFELPQISTGTFSVFSPSSNIAGWTVVGAPVLVIDTAYAEPGDGISAFTSQEGTQALDLTASAGNPLSAGIFQNITTIPLQVYTLRFEVGRATGDVIYATPTTADLSIDGGPRISFTNSDSTPGTVNWKEFSFDFLATGSNTEIKFLNGTTAANYVGLDNIRIVPEPSTAVLCLGGIFGALAVHRRRQSYP